MYLRAVDALLGRRYARSKRANLPYQGSFKLPLITGLLEASACSLSTQKATVLVP
jgi:hypothetical protein